MLLFNVKPEHQEKLILFREEISHPASFMCTRFCQAENGWTPPVAAYRPANRQKCVASNNRKRMFWERIKTKKVQKRKSLIRRLTPETVLRIFRGYLGLAIRHMPHPLSSRTVFQFPFLAASPEIDVFGNCYSANRKTAVFHTVAFHFLRQIYLFAIRLAIFNQ